MNILSGIICKLAKYALYLKGVGSRHFTYKRVMRERIGQLAQQGVSLNKLTKAEKKEVLRVFKGEHFLFEGHDLYKTVNKEFDPWIFPEDLFRIKYEPKLNNQHWANVCYEKAYFERFMPNICFPRTILRNIEGFFYDHDYNIITEEMARVLLGKYEEVVFKPSDMWCGQGVSLMQSKTVQLGKAKNYIIQELIHQHPTLQELNQSSVNIVRLITLIKGTEVIPLSASLRIGGKGQFTDNTSTPDGLGMIVIGIDENGQLKENGYYSCALSTRYNHEGLAFKGIKVPKYEEMVKIAIKNHPMIPKIRFIGWDFTVDSDGNVIVMEINPKYPGVFYYQLTNGPLFGKRSEEIYNWLKTL